MEFSTSWSLGDSTFCVCSLMEAWIDFPLPVGSLVLSEIPGRRLHQHIQQNQGMWEIRPTYVLNWLSCEVKLDFCFVNSEVRGAYPLCQLNRQNMFFFSLKCGKPCDMEEQQECCSSLWHLAVRFHSYSGWGLTGELINIHSHLIFMERINIAFVGNSRGNREHRKQHCEIRATQYKQYTLFIENQFFFGISEDWL